MPSFCRSPVLLLFFLLPSCAPTFSELQSAKLAGKGRVEITPSYTSTTFSDEGESDKVQDHVGIQFATGVSDNVDLRFRYEYISVDEEGGSSVSVVGIGPKFGFGEGKAAFYVPVGTAFGGGADAGEALQVHPTLLYTYPFSSQFELTGSGKALLMVDRDNDDLVAFNLGAGISSDLSRWALRPEAGILLNPGEDGRFWHFSVGFTYYAGQKD